MLRAVRTSLLGLAVGLLLPQVSFAWPMTLGPMPIRADFVCRFDVRTGPTALGVNAPWYTYFPYDPHLMAQPQTSPYPPWPSQYFQAPPPAGFGQMPGPSIQPTGYPAQVPSYWYGR